jgi:ABC-type glycerol-3-phosphate transport system permease component
MAVTYQERTAPAKVEKVGRPTAYYLRQALLYILLIAIGVILFMPFILASLGSFKTSAAIIAYPPTFFPNNWLWENWVRVWNTDLGQGAPFPAGCLTPPSLPYRSPYFRSSSARWLPIPLQGSDTPDATWCSTSCWRL